MIAERIGSLLIGYALGNVLTAEIVTRKLTGRPCRELGTTGNPGMANVMAHLGFKPGIITLAGDLGKCALSCLLADLLFTPAIGRIAVLYAGVGCTLGHDFPVWQKFHGGKGVATSCLAIFLFFLEAVCLKEHFPAMRTIPSGECEKIDIWGKIKAALTKKGTK